MESRPLELLTLEELAGKLKVKPSWIYARTRLTGEGTIPKLRIGRYLRFRENEVLEWLRGKQNND